MQQFMSWYVYRTCFDRLFIGFSLVGCLLIFMGFSLGFSLHFRGEPAAGRGYLGILEGLEGFRLCQCVYTPEGRRSWRISHRDRAALRAGIQHTCRTYYEVRHKACVTNLQVCCPLVSCDASGGRGILRVGQNSFSSF